MDNFKARFVGRQAHINKNGNIQDPYNHLPEFELKKSPSNRVPKSSDASPLPSQKKVVQFELDG